VADVLLLVTVEGLGAGELGCTGAPGARTPALDRLARTGLLAREALCPTPSARPALATILTGRSPSEHGLTRAPFFRSLDATSVAEAIGGAGLRTGAFSATDAADRNHGLGRGFQRHALGDGTPPLRELHEWLEADGATPAFAWVHVAGGDPAVVDTDVAAVIHALPVERRRFVVVTATSGTVDAPRAVPFLVAGPGVAAGLRRGPTDIADAASLLAGAAAGSDPLQVALAEPPDDRQLPEFAPAPLAASVRDAWREAQEFEGRGDLPAARDAYVRVATDEPRWIEATVRAADLSRRLGDRAAAARFAGAALEKVPEHPEARVLLARLLAAEGDVDSAADLLEPVLAAEPRHAAARAARAELSLLAGDPQGAVEDLRVALATARGTEDYVAVGAGLSRVGLHVDALRAVRVALERGDRSPSTRYTLAFVLERAERYPEAADEYARLIHDHPGYLPPYRNLGALMARDGEVERAIGLWESGLQYAPDDPGLKSNIETARAALGLATLGGAG
jgi:tetratricopeptide (TPR) repeat protein